MVKFRPMKKWLVGLPVVLLLIACSRQPTTALPLATEITATPAPPLAASPTVQPTLTLTPTAAPTSRFAPVTEADWQTGPVNAPVTLIEYSDFQCATCAQLASVLTRLRQEYPDDL